MLVLSEYVHFLGIDVPTQSLGGQLLKQGAVVYHAKDSAEGNMQGSCSPCRIHVLGRRREMSQICLLMDGAVVVLRGDGEGFASDQE